MPFNLEHIYKIKGGKEQPAQVGTLDDVTLRHLGWRLGFVYFSKDTYDHIRRQHPDVSDFEMLAIPLAIKWGMIVQKKDDEGYLNIFYLSPWNEKYYRLILKRTENTFEIYVASLFRTLPGKIRRVTRKGVHIRNPHMSMKFMR